MPDRPRRLHDYQIAHDRPIIGSESTVSDAEEDVAMLPQQFVGSATVQQPISVAGWMGAMVVGAAIWVVIFTFMF